MSDTPPPPVCELTPDGWQYVMPGFEPTCTPAAIRARLEALSRQPWRPAVPQDVCDFGLFDEAAQRQLEML